MDETWFPLDTYSSPSGRPRSGAPERDAGLAYEHTERTKLAVMVARATGRPLLLRGLPGTGKSTLARHAARVLGWGYEKHVVTSRTRARDLLWELDAVRRLADAQLGDVEVGQDEGGSPVTAGQRVADVGNYVVPGVLWWAFDVESAFAQLQRSAPGPAAKRAGALGDGVAHGRPRVVLIDEIDKADPDVPNDLLGPLGSMSFDVEPVGVTVSVRRADDDADEATRDAVERSRPLIVITTNEERELPPAFVRRCVVLHLDQPDAAALTRIARLHFGEAPQGEAGPRDLTDARLDAIVKRFVALRDETTSRHLSTAEFLDAVDAATDLELDLDGDAWEIIQGLVLTKVASRQA